MPRRAVSAVPVLVATLAATAAIAGPADAATGGPCPTWVRASAATSAPAVGTTAGAAVGPTRATLTLGLSARTARAQAVVQYGRSPVFRVCSLVQRLTGSRGTATPVVLRALQPDTVYSFRIVSRTASGVTATRFRTFRTLPSGHVPQGVSIGSLELGGRTRQAAASLLARGTAAPLRLTYAGAFLRVDRSSAGLRMDVRAALASALTADPGQTLPTPKVTVDRSRVRALVEKLQRRWGRAASRPSVKLVGRHAVVTKAQQAVTVDRVKTTAAIARALLSGTTVAVPVEVEKTRAPTSTSAPQKAVVVRLGSQTLTAYLDGKPVLETPVTTGRPALPTPIGSYAIKYRASPYTFTSPWPQGSPYWYPPTPVTWAMYFFDNDFLHDDPAEPESAYGAGSENGPYASHGCVHVPHDAMAYLYDWLPVGATVIVSQT